MRKTLFIIVMLAFFNSAFPQGCIPFRNLVGFGQFAKPEADPLTGKPTKLFLNFTHRYYDAHETYSGTQNANPADYNVKTMKVYTFNVGVTRVFTKGWSVSLDLPLMAGSRTAWGEHRTSDSSRQTTHSFGVEDLRVTGYKWLWDISRPTRGNIQVGVGIKFPTGNYAYTDYFYKNDSVKVLAPVNSSIQLGDGGTGLTAELNAFYALTGSITLYGNAFYLFNPRDVNGVSTTYTATPSDQMIKATADVLSVPDSYTLRAGGNLVVKDFTFWAGVRMEGAPVHDVIGASNGQRRAGKVISADPGINYKISNVTIYAFVPFPLFRETKQTVPDQRLSEYSGKTVASPGGFANYQVYLGVMIRL